LSSLVTTQSVTNAPALFTTQDLYPTSHVDVELSDGDNNGQKESAGDDVKGNVESSAEPIAPNLIGPSAAGQSHHSTVVNSGSGQKRKHVLLASKRKPSKSLADQVMTQISLPPYCGPQSPLDLVTVEFIFGRLFETFRHTSLAVRTGTSVGDDT
jgi:hypothetical protein